MRFLSPTVQNRSGPPVGGWVLVHHAGNAVVACGEFNANPKWNGLTTKVQTEIRNHICTLGQSICFATIPIPQR